MYVYVYINRHTHSHTRIDVDRTSFWKIDVGSLMNVYQTIKHHTSALSFF